MSKPAGHKEGQFGFEANLGNLFGGIGNLVQKLSELAEKGGELRREGGFEIPKDAKGLKGVYGFTVKLGGLGGEPVSVEPFGNIRKDKRGEPTVTDEREPLVDVFNEDDHVLVVAEVPGVEESKIKTELKGDVLVLAAEGRDRKYRKEVLLPRVFKTPAVARSFRGGILEIRITES